MNYLEAFEFQMTYWEKTLKEISLIQLVEKPADGWSMGQLYLHLISDTDWYFDQASLCFGNILNVSESMNEDGAKIFSNNSFPDVRIKNEQGDISQPVSISDLEIRFKNLRTKAKEINNKSVKGETIYGKSKHPGFGYFTPLEWLQFAEMHMRHHMKQKSRILMGLKK